MTSNPPPAAVSPADSAVIDRIALLLAAAPDWNADQLEAIADHIGTVRRHPGGIESDELAAYAAQLPTYR